MTLFPFSLFARVALRPGIIPSLFAKNLFSAERIEEHARSLATAQKVTPSRSRGIRWRVASPRTAPILLAAYKSLSAGSRRRSRRHACGGMADRQLPPHRKADPRNPLGSAAGLLSAIAQTRRRTVSPATPRVRPGLGLCRPYRQPLRLRHAGSAIVRAYQEVQPLTIGELWAVSITLRIVMIENLRRLAEQIVNGRAARHLADDLADRLLGAAGQNPESLKVALADHRGRRPLGGLRRPAHPQAARSGPDDHPGADLAGPASGGAAT